MRWIARACVVATVVGSALWALPAGAAAPAVVSPPDSIPSGCAQDVSQQMQHWLNSLPADTTVEVPAGDCYLVDEGLRITGAQNLTISGGTWRDAASPAPGGAPSSMGSVFWLVGGSGITLEHLSILGASPGGYNPSAAFAAGIRSDGVIGLSVSDVEISNVYGDGVELAPLRGANDLSGVIVNPTEDASVSNVVVDGAGRQGITLSSVTDATISSVALKHIGLNAFDVEADQWNEGAKNVTINGCTVGGGIGGLFFANGGASAGGAWTGNVTVENCTMQQPLAGEAILVKPPSPSNNPRGPFTFQNDSLYCGSSVYVACVESVDGQISISNSSLRMLPGTIHEPVFEAVQNSALSFGADTVNGYGTTGTADKTSTVGVSGGSWSPYRPPSPFLSAAPSTTTPAPAVAGTSPAGAGAAPHAASSPPVSTAVPPSAPATPRRGVTTLATTRQDPATTSSALPSGRSIIDFELAAAVAAGCAAVLARTRRKKVRAPYPASTIDLLRPSWVPMSATLPSVDVPLPDEVPDLPSLALVQTSQSETGNRHQGAGSRRRRPRTGAATVGRREGVLSSRP